jgi:HEAT repeat protein
MKTASDPLDLARGPLVAGKPAAVLQAAEGQVQTWISHLASKDGLVRQRARWALVALGVPAVRPLAKALSDRRAQVRWEAAKALTKVHDGTAVPALLAALEDKDDDVAWLAAEALIALGREALAPVLESLIARPDSEYLREAAHHILKACRTRQVCGILAPVVRALWHSDPEETVPVAAEQALEELRKGDRLRQRRA